MLRLTICKKSYQLRTGRDASTSKYYVAAYGATMEIRGLADFGVGKTIVMIRDKSLLKNIEKGIAMQTWDSAQWLTVM